MKKFSLYALSVIFILASPFAFSARDTRDSMEENQEEIEEIESPAETKKRLSANVEKSENDDVVIRISVSDSSRKGEAIPSLLRTLLAYTVLDFKEMPSARGGEGSREGGSREAGSRDGGKSSEKRERPSGDSKHGDNQAPAMKMPSINEIVKTVNLSLSKNKMSLKSCQYSQGTTQLLLTNGSAIFSYLKNDKKAFDAIAERSNSRPNSKGEMLKWKTSLREKTQKKLESTKETFTALIIGYNKDTKEYLLHTENYGAIWLLESELKLALSQSFYIKY